MVGSGAGAVVSTVGASFVDDYVAVAVGSGVGVAAVF